MNVPARAEQHERVESVAHPLLHLLEDAAADVASKARPGDVVTAIGRSALSVAGVVGTSVGLCLIPGGPLRLVRIDGFSEDTVDRWQAIAPDAPVPLIDVLRTGEALYFPSRSALLERYPHLAEAIERTDHRAWAAIPLRGAGQSNGVIGLTWNHERRVDPSERLFLSTLGRLGGEALVRAMRESERRSLLLRLADSAEQERAAIAVNLHDDTIQRVASVLLRLGSVRAEADPRVAALVSDCENELGSVVTSLRELIFTLHPPDVGPLQLGEAVRDFVSWRFGQSQDRVTVFNGVGTALPPVVSLAAYRIVQEALTNVHKHAFATSIAVHLGTLESTLRLRIRDNGRGSSHEETTSITEGHIGFRTMRERAEALGGTLDFTTAPGAGFELRAELPLDVDAEPI